MVEGEPLDVVCAADGHPRPALDISLDRNGTQPTIMALASGVQTPTMVNDQFKPSVYEAYRIVGLTPTDNGRNVTCHVDMKQIDRRLTLSTTKQLYIECMFDFHYYELRLKENSCSSSINALTTRHTNELISIVVFFSDLVRPTVAEKSKKIYCGINQTRTINCTILQANPTYIRYSINGLPSSVLRRTYGDQHDLHYTFDITPTSIEQFRPFNVTANNSIGFDTCTYELIHGGKAMRGQENLVVIKSNLLAPLPRREKTHARRTRTKENRDECGRATAQSTVSISDWHVRRTCHNVDRSTLLHTGKVHFVIVLFLVVIDPPSSIVRSREREQVQTFELAAHFEEQLSHRLRSIIETLPV